MIGRPQTVVVDLTCKFPARNREVRIVTNMRIYWDQILVDTSSDDVPMPVVRLEPVSADLHWRDFSAIEQKAREHGVYVQTGSAVFLAGRKGYGRVKAIG